MKIVIRKIHKYLSFFISVQLLLWTVSGIYFAYNQIELVRGEHLRNQSYDEIDFNLKELPSIKARSMKPFIRLGELLIQIETANQTLYLKQDGTEASQIGLNQAMEIVDTKTSLQALTARELFELPAGAEYRGRSLPLYQVQTNHKDSINVYVDAWTGDIVAIRSSSWRLWDLMWGLHIMDYVDRDNINNILLKVFSILALISSLSGVILFFITPRRSTS
jgi:uncharacterized iron-regulated membrane protein